MPISITEKAFELGNDHSVTESTLITGIAPKKDAVWSKVLPLTHLAGVTRNMMNNKRTVHSFSLSLISCWQLFRACITFACSHCCASYWVIPSSRSPGAKTPCFSPSSQLMRLTLQEKRRKNEGGGTGVLPVTCWYRPSPPPHPPLSHHEENCLLLLMCIFKF